MTKLRVSELVFASWAVTTGARSVATFCSAIGSRFPLTVTSADSPGAKVTVALGSVEVEILALEMFAVVMSGLEILALEMFALTVGLEIFALEMLALEMFALTLGFEMLALEMLALEIFALTLGFEMFAS